VEKVLYVLWRSPDQERDDFARELVGPVGRALLDLDPLGLQINVADASVDPTLIRMAALDPQMEAVVGLWLDTAMAAARAPFEAVLRGAAGRVEGYLVTESEPLRNTTRVAPLGERTDGLSNIAFLRRREELSQDEFLDRWQNGHTPVAIETQSTFQYVQNVVVRALDADAPTFSGIVEEVFPPEAMTDLHVFFDTGGDEALLAERLTGMTASTGSFLSDTLDVVPTSQYVLRRAGRG
jgi:hypothetical protein